MEPTDSPAPPKKRSRWRLIILVVALLAVLAVVALPVVVGCGPGPDARKNRCVNNLRQIDGAKDQWALEKKLSAGAPVTKKDEGEILGYIKGGKIPVCPAKGAYNFNSVDAVPTCSVRGHSL